MPADQQTSQHYDAKKLLRYGAAMLLQLTLKISDRSRTHLTNPLPSAARNGYSVLRILGAQCPLT